MHEPSAIYSSERNSISLAGVQGLVVIRGFFLHLLAVSSLHSFEPWAFGGQLPCPALKVGKPFPLPIAPVADSALRLDSFIPAPDELSKTAAEIVGKFESGGGDPWVAVSGHERVSIGVLQWNWSSGSLISVFFRSLPDRDIDLAPAQIRGDLRVLKSYADDKTNASKRELALSIVDGWTSHRSDDPLIRGVRKTVTGDLRLWLATPPIRAHQTRLLDSDMRQAYALARAWRRDSAGDGLIVPVDARLLATFFDLVVFNGGRAGIWVPHVRRFQQEHADERSVITYVSDWLRSCNDTFVTGKEHPRMYTREDGVRNAKYWSELISRNGSLFREDQIDLFIFGFLRATRSIGSNPPKGFPGIYQADVMTRRGVIALGSGYVRRSANPIRLFEDR
jgi:hypothetical protein